MSKACLVDTTKCIGCRACQVACKQWNEMPAEDTKFWGTGGGYENPPALSTKTRTRITFHEILDAKGDLERSVFVKRQCMHCLDPGCASACLVKAFNRTPEGGVIWDEKLCMGCRYCMVACPFDTPKFEYDNPIPSLLKCTFCFDRTEEAPSAGVKVNDESLEGESLARFHDGQRTPACAKACPSGAIKFGQRDQLLVEAHRRIAMQNNTPGISWKYQEHIYGENEVGGTGWLYISNVPFEQLGFATLGNTPIPEYTKGFLNAVAPVIVLGAGLGTGLYWFTQRRDEVAEAEAATAEHKEN